MKRSRTYYLFAFLLSVFFIMSFNHRITIIFFIAVLALPLLSYLLMLLNYYFIKFDVTVERKIYEKKELASTLIKISNEGLLPTPFIKVKMIQIDESGKGADENIYALSLAPFKSIDFRNDTVMKRRGLYQVGIKSVELYDMFGLFKIRRTLNIIEEVLVLPKKILLMGNMLRSITSEDGEEKNKYKIGEDRTIISHVREYADGDNVNSVHWKLSSKKDDLIVKVYDYPNDNNILIIADMQSHEPDDPDLAEDSGDAVVEASLALALKCVYEGKACVLYWYDTQQTCIVWYEIGTLSDFATAFNHLAVTQESYDDITAETILKNNEICDTHKKIIYIVNQGLDIQNADILSQLAAFDDNEINCLCMDLKNHRETSDFINELCLANVNAAKYSRGAAASIISGTGETANAAEEFERFLNGFIA